MVDFSNLLDGFFGSKKDAEPNAWARREYVGSENPNQTEYRIPEFGLTVKEFRNGVADSDRTRFIVEVGGSADANLKAMSISNIAVSSGKLTVYSLDGKSKDVPFEFSEGNKTFDIDVRNMRDGGNVTIVPQNPEGVDMKVGVGKIANSGNSFTVDLSKASKLSIDQFEGKGRTTIIGLSQEDAKKTRGAMNPSAGSRAHVAGKDGVELINSQGTMNIPDPAEAPKQQDQARQR